MTGLTVTPALWGAIVAALDSSEYFLLLASPQAAKSHWVDQEVRHWLSQPRAAIDGYIRRYQLQPIEDPSNADVRWARNRLRAEVWPALIRGFADAEQSLVAVADRAAEASAALAEWTAVDLVALERDGALDRAAWLALSPARRALVLRAWLAKHLPSGAPESLVKRLLQEWPCAGTAQWPIDGERVLQSYRGRLSSAFRAAGQSAPDTSEAFDLSTIGDHDVPAWRGHFEVRPTAADGIAPALLREVHLRARSGGERFQRAECGQVQP